MERYDPQKIEKKWQKIWEDTQAFRADDSSKKPKEYLLVEFPYPSGEGLHVGHIRSWTALDVVARKHRAQGKNVLYPIGWDAFGLPAENYAIKTGIHPMVVTKQNTDNFRRQIQSLGISFDWSREVNTTDPAYYKWTQWIFLQLYKKGLAYKAKTLINWCPKDKIGLANEEVVDGACERCGQLVEKREKEQWMLAITKYAQRLYDDLDTVNYIEAAKAGQRNWIGPSEGAEITFEISRTVLDKIKVFTTRPDTLFGATYLVLAPEHEHVAALALQIKNWDEVEKYIYAAKNKSDIDRSAEGKEKTGVELKGITAVNPATKEEIPVYIADYVLGGYGTGAIMAVPAHDQRDYEFAKKFNLPVKEVIEECVVTEGNRDDAYRPEEKTELRTAVATCLYDPKTERFMTISWKAFEMRGVVTGGVEDNESVEDCARREILEESGYKNIRFVGSPDIQKHTKFYHRGKKVNRHSTWRFAFFELVDEERGDMTEADEAQHDIVWVEKSKIKDYFTVAEARWAIDLYLNQDQEEIITSNGILINSGEFDGMTSAEAKRTIAESVGGKMVTTYKLRDWVFSRQRYWGEPIPMINCVSCGWQPVPEDQLPVELPTVEKYQPTDNGESPLAGISEWVETTCPKCKGPAKRETDVMPNWAGSSWYYLRYADPTNGSSFASPEKLNYWTPVDWYNGGMEHTTLHLLYSRFWHKFLFDIGVVPTSEPYMKRTSHGLILAEGGEKMSKSKGNSVSPDQLVEKFGADTLRVYEMFIGPFDQPVAWSTQGMVGVQRFLERVWRLSESLSSGEINTTPTPPESDVAEPLEILLHQTIKKVGEDIEQLKMNTAVSSLMILLNALEKNTSRAGFSTFVVLLAPFAPHLAHELAEVNGIGTLVWPAFDNSKLQSDTAIVAIQVDGKLRAKIELPVTLPEIEAIEVAKGDPQLKKWLNDKEISKVVYVPGRIISFLTAPRSLDL